jgi:Flp pilus assembly protein TadG
MRDDRGSVAAEMLIATPVLLAILVLVAVVIHRGVTARLTLDDVAYQAARAASLARDPATAATAARTVALQTLDSDRIACLTPVVDVDTHNFRPGGLVTVTVTCHVDLNQAQLLHVPAQKTLSARASSPIDTYRGDSVSTGASS